MGNPEESKPQAAAAYGDSAPPPYSEASQSSRLPNPIQPQQDVSVSAGAVLAPYKPIPPVLDAYYQWKISTTFHLGNAADKRLFAVAVHTGLAGRGPGRPGVILHNGPTDKDPMLAAVNDELGNTMSLNSVITLPQPAGTTTAEYSREVMQSAMRSGTATFRFSAEVRQKEALRREDFEWQKSRGDEDRSLIEPPWKCGFKLLRLSPQSREENKSSEGTSQGSAGEGPEVIAVFA